MKRLILTLTVLILSPGYIFSQQTVEEVIVTATKTEKTLQEVPIAVSVVTAETIEKSNITDIYDLRSIVRILALQSSEIRQAIVPKRNRKSLLLFTFTYITNKLS